MSNRIEKGDSRPQNRAYQGKTIEELREIRRINILPLGLNEPQLLSVLLPYNHLPPNNSVYTVVNRKFKNYEGDTQESAKKHQYLLRETAERLEQNGLVIKDESGTSLIECEQSDDFAVKALALLSLGFPLKEYFSQAPQSRIDLFHYILTARESQVVYATSITNDITRNGADTTQKIHQFAESGLVTYTKERAEKKNGAVGEVGYVSLSPEQEENMRLLVSAASETFSTISEDSLRAIGEDLGISVEEYKDKKDLLRQLVGNLVSHPTLIGQLYNSYRETAIKLLPPVEIDTQVLFAVAQSTEPAGASSWREKTGNTRDTVDQAERLLNRGLIISNARRGLETKFALHPEVREEIDKLRTAITNVLLYSDQEPNANELIKFIPLIADKYNALAEPLIELMTRDLRQKLEEKRQQRLRKERTNAFMSLKGARQDVLQQVVDNGGNYFIKALKPQFNTINEYFSGEKSNKLALAQALLIALNLDLSTQMRNKQAVFSDSREKLWGEIVNFARYVAEGSIDMQLRNLGKTIKDKSYVLGNERYNYIFMENDHLIPVQPEVRDVLSTIVVSKAASAMQLLRVLPQEDLAGVVIALLSGDLAFALED